MIRRVELPAGVVTVADVTPAATVGTPLLLLHGFTGDHTAFDGILPALAADRRVLVPDLPGHGATALVDEACSLAAAATLLAAVLARCEVPRAAVVGYSMGGRLALQLALTAPALVERLVLVSASAGLATAAERAARRAQDEALACFIAEHPIAAFVERWEALPLFATEQLLPAAVREARRRQRLRARPAGLAASLRGMGAGAQPWLGPWLETLAVPTLVVAGARDPKFAAIAGTLAAAIPAATLAIVDGAGHAVHLERAAAFSALVRAFLDQGKEDRCRSTG